MFHSATAGPFVSDLSGTVGASRVSVGRGISSIAFSASSAPRDYTLLDLNNPQDESILIGTQAANLISRYGDARGNARLVSDTSIGRAQNQQRGKLSC